jgi:hypothetical protein
MLFGISDIFMAIICAAVCIPLIRGDVKMNGCYGVRFKKSFESEENWYKINKYGGRCLVAWSGVLLLIGIAEFLIPYNPKDTFRTVLSTCAPGILLIPCIQAYLYAKKL